MNAPTHEPFTIPMGLLNDIAFVLKRIRQADPKKTLDEMEWFELSRVSSSLESRLQDYLDQPVVISASTGFGPGRLTYSDGTTVAGASPFPPLSPSQQDAA